MTTSDTVDRRHRCGAVGWREREGNPPGASAVRPLSGAGSARPTASEGRCHRIHAPCAWPGKPSSAAWQRLRRPPGGHRGRGGRAGGRGGSSAARGCGRRGGGVPSTMAVDTLGRGALPRGGGPPAGRVGADPRGAPRRPRHGLRVVDLPPLPRRQARQAGHQGPLAAALASRSGRARRHSRNFTGPCTKALAKNRAQLFLDGKKVTPACSAAAGWRSSPPGTRGSAGCPAASGRRTRRGRGACRGARGGAPCPRR